jgi:hypothetical protein
MGAPGARRGNHDGAKPSIELACLEDSFHSTGAPYDVDRERLMSIWRDIALLRIFPGCSAATNSEIPIRGE